MCSWAARMPLCQQTLLTAKGTRGVSLRLSSSGRQAGLTAGTGLVHWAVCKPIKLVAWRCSSHKSVDAASEAFVSMALGAGGSSSVFFVPNCTHSSSGRVVALAVVELEAVVGTVLVLENGCELCLVLPAVP